MEFNNKPPRYNITQIETLLNAKEVILNFNAPLIRTTNIIEFFLNSYVSFTALSASNYITNSTSGLTKYCNKTEVDNISNFNSNFTTQQSNILNTAINTKEAILTFNSPLTWTTNTIGIYLNSFFLLRL